MPVARFSFPKQWEDWTNWILGIWLCISPWALHFESQTTLVENAVVVGFLLILVEVVELSSFRPWQEWINVVLGAWLVVSPWVLGSTRFAANADFVIVGVLVLGFALYEIWDVRRHPANRS
jgi:hypothetical protein